MKIGTIAHFKEEGNLFDPHYSLYETRRIPKGQKVEILTLPDAEKEIKVKFIDGEFEGEEIEISMYEVEMK